MVDNYTVTGKFLGLVLCICEWRVVNSEVTWLDKGNPGPTQHSSVASLVCGPWLPPVLIAMPRKSRGHGERDFATPCIVTMDVDKSVQEAA